MSDRLPRYWRESNWPRPMSPLLPESVSTAVYCELSRLLYITRDDPAQLATCLAAGARLGYLPGNLNSIIENGGAGWESGFERISQEEANELAQKAMRGRHRRVLTARADGLILALRHSATAAQAHRLHERQTDAAVIECRFLSIDERIANLRAADRSLAIKAQEAPTTSQPMDAPSG